MLTLTIAIITITIQIAYIWNFIIENEVPFKCIFANEVLKEFAPICRGSGLVYTRPLYTLQETLHF